MSSQAIGQRFRVSRGGCWQCVPDCRSRLAEALMFFRVAYNYGYAKIFARCTRHARTAESAVGKRVRPRVRRGRTGKNTQKV